jgi:hypothetical protein
VRDILGVQLAIGQRVVFCAPTRFSSGTLRVGIIAAISPSIAIRCAGERVVLPAMLSNCICVVRDDTDGEAWLRRQLEAI